MGEKKRHSLVIWILRIPLILIIIGIVLCLAFVRNPVMIKRVDANQSGTLDLAEVYSPVNPYIKINHMDVEYSGFYSVDDNDNICSYYYFGSIGKHYYFVEISSDKINTLDKDLTEGLEDFSFTGIIIEDTEILNIAAEREGLTTEEYLETFDICSVSISQVNNDLERVYIYYGLAILVAIGIILMIQMIKSKEES